MSKTLVIGASGQIGQLITKTLVETEEDARALVRDKSKLDDLKDSDLEIVEADLEGDFSQAFDGIDNVIFVAGSGGSTGADKTLLIDLWAAKKAVDYAKAANVKQFIMVSSIGADDPEAIESDIKPYLVAKHMADQYLMASGVPFTIVRPGPLTNDEGQGKITIKRPNSREEMAIPRADVAKSVLFILSKDDLNGKIFELFGGTYDVDNVLV
ncbi:MAG: SDR family oxidoreductase [Gammaproteobacteria bacterium]|uniref:SDR family oxidoreductase n=1 Tax=Marinomonas sp. BSi20584 TaxID=1594462 RepID=UPI000C1E89B9|nr:SDR family oxidoreductase [Marinomonas sp. BSi20584]MBU1296226.1 SDR family oxidoreductase [Gammaproteobacteria bacterium]MBU2240057.1 SDR family oxidoreductase [Gammaproteobacteria bacterium]MBU2319866.1 SDR family oxidoreductase [Gammaproteobacteria bacterium]MBU2412122.1 SDR family oxidoreductase [Gammaproteobacteria bacterium]PJE54115.1 oxidoreductase [Marinomonas sp. BSi20584]